MAEGGVLLTTVSDVFALKDGRLIVGDEFELPAGQPAPSRCTVTLRRPDGTSIRAEPEITRPLINRHPYRPPGLMCMLWGVSKTDVPVGTEVLLESAADA